MDQPFTADLLHTYRQLTPWVQAVLGLCMTVNLVAGGYFLQRMLTAVFAGMALLVRRPLGR